MTFEITELRLVRDAELWSQERRLMLPDATTAIVLAADVDGEEARVIAPIPDVLLHDRKTVAFGVFTAVKLSVEALFRLMDEGPPA
jgi:hypothetical protein